MKHEFKSDGGKWVLVVNTENGFYLYDNDNPTDVIIDASTLFSRENAWIELLDPQKLYEFYSKCDTKKGNSFGLRSKRDE